MGGIAIGAASLPLVAGAAAVALAGVGTVMVVAAVATAATKGFPPAMKPAQELVGQVVELDALSNAAPTIQKLAIIGPGRAGKTTLRNRLAFDLSPLTRTQEISAYVASLQTHPQKYLAILDGQGDRFAQQFKLAELCDCLCIVIDHNASDSDAAIDPVRVSQHRDFLTQIKHHLDQSGAGKKQRTYILMNKRDLWASAPKDQQAALIEFVKGETEGWKNEKRAKKVDFRAHSNNIHEDVAQFMSLLKSL